MPLSTYTITSSSPRKNMQLKEKLNGVPPYAFNRRSSSSGEISATGASSRVVASNR